MPDKGYWQRSPAIDLKKPVNNCLACDFYFSFFSYKISFLSFPETSIDNKSLYSRTFFYIKAADLPATNPATNWQPSQQQIVIVRQSTPSEVPAGGIPPHSVPQIHLRCRKCPVPSPFVCHIRRTVVKGLSGELIDPVLYLLYLLIRNAIKRTALLQEPTNQRVLLFV